MTLSHWPSNDTPVAYKRDLSAEIVFAALDDPDFAPPCRVVTNNHYDEDGLVSAFALARPDIAGEYREELIAVARAGDFGVFDDRAAARASFVLSAWANSRTSPLNSTVFKKSHDQIVAILYEELLPRLPSVINKIGNLHRYWQEEDDFLEATEQAIARGRITIEEDGEKKLAIVRVDEGLPPRPDQDGGASWISSVLHPMSIHSRTDCMAILVVKGRMLEFYYRYETWVDFVSRPLLKRRDLAPLVTRLDALERGRGKWSYSGTDDIIARLSLSGREMSEVGEVRFLEFLRECL